MLDLPNRGRRVACGSIVRSSKLGGLPQDGVPSWTPVSLKDNSAMRTHTILLLCGGVAFAFAASEARADKPAQSTVDYEVATIGTRQINHPDGSTFVKMLVEAANLGGTEVEMAEITFPANSRGQGHPHGSIEIFYVLSGQLTHVVNGKGARQSPGMVGIVRPGDIVEHITELDEPTRALVIWVPGGEIDRSFGAAEMTPIAKVPLENLAPGAD